MALELLLDDEVKLVTLLGKAGTGKTLLALAAGMQKHLPRKSVFDAPARQRGRSCPSAATSGYLPGDVEEKLNAVDAAHLRQPRVPAVDAGHGTSRTRRARRARSSACRR